MDSLNHGNAPFEAAQASQAWQRSSAGSRHRLVLALASQVLPQLVQAGLNVPRQKSGLERPSSIALGAKLVKGAVVVKQVIPAGVKRTEVTRLHQACLEADRDLAFQIVMGALARGVSESVVLQELLGAVARNLGARWQNDSLSFAQVTVGCSVVQQLVDDVDQMHVHMVDSPVRLVGNVVNSEKVLSALVTVVPGSQHIIGAKVFSSMLRNDGWRSCTLLDTSEKKLFKAVGSARIDVIAFSVGAQADLVGLPKLFKQIRAQSLNPYIAIILGGALLVDDSLDLATRTRFNELIIKAGADLVGTDASAAIVAARRLVANLETTNITMRS
jgi:methanogenic corrinoid protein MtbC1